MSDELNTAAEVLSPVQEKALKQQKAWGRFLNLFNIGFTVAAVLVFVVVYFTMM